MVKIPKERLFLFRAKNKKFNHKFILDLKYWLVASSLEKIIKKNGIEVVIAVLGKSQFVGRLAKLVAVLRRGRAGFSLISYYRNVNYAIAPLTTWPRRIFNTFLSVMARLDDKTIFVSRAVEKDICSHIFIATPKKVIYNSLPFRMPDPQVGRAFLKQNNLPLKPFTIVFPGRLHSNKGHLFFLEALSELLADRIIDRDEILVIIAGAGPAHDLILTKVIQLEFPDICRLVGTVPNEILLSLYRLVSLVVVPSLHEGFGNVAIEPIMCGCPVLTSDSGGLDEIIIDGYNGFKFQTGNKAALREKLTYIYQCRSTTLLRQENQVADYQRRFTLESQIEQLLAFVGTNYGRT